MKRLVVSFSLSLVLLAPVVEGGERRALSYVPADAVLALCYDPGHPGFKDTSLYRFSQEPEVKEAARQWRPLIDRALEAVSEGDEFDIASVLRALAGCEMAVAGVADPEKPGELALLLAARVGTGDAPARRVFERAMEQLQAEAKPGSVRQFEIGRLKATGFISEDGEPDCFVFDGPYFVLAESKSGALLRRMLDPAAPKLATQLKERALLRFRYDHKAMLKGLLAGKGREGRKVLDAIGLGPLRSVDLAFVPRGKRLVTKFEADFSGEGPRVGVAKWFADAPPFDPGLLKMVPRDAQLFWLSAMNLPGLWDETWASIARVDPRAAQEGRLSMAELADRLGLEFPGVLLRRLGRGTLLISSTDGGVWGGWSVLVQRVRDGQALERDLAQFVGRLGVLLGDPREPAALGIRLKTFQYRGHTCYYVPITGWPFRLMRRGPGPMVPDPGHWLMGYSVLTMTGRAPCFANLGDVFVFAQHPLHLKSYLDFLTDRGPTILDNPEFQSLRKSVPSGATSISYGQWADTIVAFYNTLAPFLMLFQWVEGVPGGADLANMPSSRLMRRYARGTVAYSIFDGGRYRIEVQGDGVDLLSPHVAPVGVAAVLAGMLLPALTRARSEARLIRDRNNLNQIAKGCATYLNEFGDNRFYPKSTGELFDKGVIPDKGVFVSPLDRAPPKLPNGLPCSYVSCFDKYPKRVFRDDFPPNVMMAWDRKAFLKGRRNVLFFDSHVECVGEPRFQGLLKQLDEHVKRLTQERKKGAQF